MSPDEKSAVFTFAGFLAASEACAVFVAAGESVLNWEKRHVWMGFMVVFITNTYCERCPGGIASILLVVLVASLVIMLTLSATSLLLYRSHRGGNENSY